MKSQKNQAFLNIEYSSHSQEINLWHFSGEFTQPKRKYPARKIDMNHLLLLIKEYWEYVDKCIRDDILETGERDQKVAFLDSLKSRGNSIAQLLFPADVQGEIWKIAAESDILVVHTNLPEIPYEALFSNEYGEKGTFLSDNCVIQRQIEINQSFALDLSRREAPLKFVCVDSKLLEEEAELEGRISGEIKRSDLAFVKTTTISALLDTVKDASTIHWICEHQDEGLRLKHNFFYSIDDVAVHKFPKDCVLFMLSCAAARPTDLRPGNSVISYSASVAGVSGCTVVAPSSIVAAKAAVKFVFDFERVVSNNNLSLLSDIWTRMKNPLGGRSYEEGISAEDCYLLWFGIYGDCNVKIKEGVI